MGLKLSAQRIAGKPPLATAVRCGEFVAVASVNILDSESLHLAIGTDSATIFTLRFADSGDRT